MSNVLKTLKHALEIIWLFAAIACLGIAIYETMQTGIKSALPFYLFCAFSLFFYFSRRKDRVVRKD